MNSIYNIKKINNDDDKFYCFKGLEEFIDNEGFPRISDGNNSNVVAQAVKSRYSSIGKADIAFNNYKYFVKISPQKTLYNPTKIDNNTSQNKFINSKCKSEWMLQEVNQYIFDKYIMFLKTEDNRWIKAAEREMK
jgi:hypothetical protein